MILCPGVHGRVRLHGGAQSSRDDIVRAVAAMLADMGGGRVDEERAPLLASEGKKIANFFLRGAI